MGDLALDTANRRISVLLAESRELKAEAHDLRKRWEEFDRHAYSFLDEIASSTVGWEIPQNWIARAQHLQDVLFQLNHGPQREDEIEDATK
jgi:hypothetical protein